MYKYEKYLKCCEVISDIENPWRTSGQNFASGYLTLKLTLVV